MALSSILANKMRSFLTMLGIIIGIISLVVLVSIINSATSSITAEIDELGSDMLFVYAGDSKGNPLQLSDLKEIESIPSVGLTTPLKRITLQAKHGYNSDYATGYCVTASISEIQKQKLEAGRFLKTTDIENSSYVAVLDYRGAVKLFGTPYCIGETVHLNDISFLVVGVLEESKSSSSMMPGKESEVYIPYTTANRIGGQEMDMNMPGINEFMVSVADGFDIYATENDLNIYMLNRFKQDSEAFDVINIDTITQAMSEITAILSFVLGGIASIALLVGGIGIMNIMLVSVTERTREIGIRKAIGASTGSILSQFLIEALVLSLMGCFIGVAISWGIIAVISAAAAGRIAMDMSFGVVMIAVSFSMGIGVIFGIYPARKAAHMNPIDALRYN
ncbi:MAG: ABC transporter permease [Clostridia bacterium]|nr:ABC transporter permease [Clostridia bacterium]